MSWIAGNATWYDLCFHGAHDTGSGGACGSCDDRQLHAAWPNLTTTGCNDHCGPNTGKPCNSDVCVHDQCNLVRKWGKIKDCCPCRSQQGCDRTPLCNGSPDPRMPYHRPIIDLTTAYFIALDGDLADGRIPVDVYVS